MFLYSESYLERSRVETIVMYTIAKSINKCAVDIYESITKNTTLSPDLTISANLMVRNEESCIERCLFSIEPYVDEIIVVDTGSADKTVKLIERFNSSKLRFYELEWRDDFSLVRNFMLKKSTCDIIFSIDADEFIDKDVKVEEFKELISRIISFLGDTTAISLSMIDSIGVTYDTIPRVFKNSVSFYYYGYVHEELRTRNSEPLHLIYLDFALHHDGYEKAKILSQGKTERNIYLLKKMLKGGSENFRWYYFLMRDLFILKRFDRELLLLARLCFAKLESEESILSIYRKPAYVYVALIFFQFDKIGECSKVVELLYSEYPDDVDCLYIKIKIMKKQLSNIIRESEEILHASKLINSSDSVLYLKREKLISEYFFNCLQLLDFCDYFPLLNDVNHKQKQFVVEEIKKKLRVFKAKCSQIEDIRHGYNSVCNISLDGRVED